MKKKLLLTIALLVAATSSFAQNSASPVHQNGYHVSVVAPSSTPSSVKLVAPTGPIELYPGGSLALSLESADGDLVPGSDAAVDLGAPATRFDNLYTKKALANADSAAALDADVVTMCTAAPAAGIAGTSATQSHLALIQNVASAQGADIVIAKTRAAAGSTNANTVVSSGDDIAKLRFFGADGAAYKEAAQILVEVDAAAGTDDMAGQIKFLVSPDGSATPAEAVNIDSTKLVTFANGITVTTGDAILSSGDLTLAATGKTIEFETGTAASACAGNSTFNGTTAVTISTTCATTGSRIFLSNTGDGSGTAGNDQSGCWATNIQNGVSFDADCSDADMNATFNWIIFHEAP